MKSITLERRFFKNDDEWLYMLDQLGINKFNKDTADCLDDIESISFFASISDVTLDDIDGNIIKTIN